MLLRTLGTIVFFAAVGFFFTSILLPDQTFGSLGQIDDLVSPEVTQVQNDVG